MASAHGIKQNALHYRCNSIFFFFLLLLEDVAKDNTITRQNRLIFAIFPTMKINFAQKWVIWTEMEDCV